MTEQKTNSMVEANLKIITELKLILEGVANRKELKSVNLE